MNCSFPGCNARATHYERTQAIYAPEDASRIMNSVARAYCADHDSEDDCRGHVASKDDAKICGRCGIHIDSLRPY